MASAVVDAHLPAMSIKGFNMCANTYLGYLGFELSFEFLCGSVFSYTANTFWGKAIILPHLEVGRVGCTNYVRKVRQPLIYSNGKSTYKKTRW